jgi:hypothetical protein
MRGLNLSRLARSSEASHFAELQQAQARDLRRKLPADALVAARVKAAAAARPTVDVDSAVAAHSAYARVIADAPVVASVAPVLLPLLSRLPTVDASTIHVVRPGATRESLAPDSQVVKVIGQGRMAMYKHILEQNSQSAAARALPGIEVKAEGAMVAAQAFVVATALVGSVGIAGLLYLYFADGVIDRLRDRTVAFRDRVEEGFLGRNLKSLSARMHDSGGIISPESAAAARQFARKAVRGDNRSQKDA